MAAGRVKSPGLKRLLLRAAATIERDAEELRNSCREVGTYNYWACDDCRASQCEARRIYESDIRLSRRLRREAISNMPGRGHVHHPETGARR